MDLMNGVSVATVVDNRDSDGLGRVGIRVAEKPKRGGKGEVTWARIATLMAGRGRGTWFIPEVGDEVLVAFEAGDPKKPYVLGALWNVRNPPPAKMESTNALKLIRSRNGVTVSIEDIDGEESVSIATPGGQQLTLRDGPGAVVIKDSNGNSIELGTTGVRITAAAGVFVAASKVEVSAGMVTVNAGMSKFSGVVQCDTLISNSVVSASYSPGAGNVM
jgi:uncharacterized protein involved in type VI secretion and phage assembly